jgi:hypothetical protein
VVKNKIFILDDVVKMFENIPRNQLYFMLLWLAVSIVGIVMATINLARIKDCRVWQRSDNKKFAEGSNGYIVAIFGIQVLLLVYFLFEDKILSILRS